MPVVTDTGLIEPQPVPAGSLHPTVHYILGRIAQAAVLLAGIVIAVFFVLRLTAGDPAKIALPAFSSPAVIEAYRKQFGTNRPILAQFGSFIIGVFHGNLGVSFRYQRDVASLVFSALPYTLALAGIALAIGVGTAIALGVLAARYPKSVADGFAGVLATIGQSMPTFWVGLLLVSAFSVRLHIFPASGYVGWQSLVLPSIAVALGIIPAELRVLRSSMKDVYSQEYILAARAYGIREARVNFIYALRNACIPLMTIVGIDMGYLLGGVIVAEAVFNYPGIGSLALLAFTARDYPLIQGITIVTAGLFVILNLVIDLLYVVVDPRIRLTRE